MLTVVQEVEVAQIDPPLATAPIIHLYSP